MVGSPKDGGASWSSNAKTKVVKGAKSPIVSVVIV
jgi:hypothetical protein